MAQQEEKVQAGDVVQLKSGGPKMTAEHYSNSHGWYCKWFVGEDLRNGSFFEEAITKDIKLKTGRISPQ